ncbi:MAG TPA: response regulator transcription factor [Catalimonadaceae bacterium]|nr:response regulator transcription factor [Catalimonadaceae bacterium]
MKAVIIDDEYLARELIANHISNIPGMEIAGKFQNPVEALPFLHQNPVELLFLDIHMPQISGMEMIRLLHYKPKVILTTAFQDYALEAYSLDVVDYLLKPVSFSRFLQAINKLGPLSSAAIEDLNPGFIAKDHFWIRTQQKSVRIQTDDLIMVEGQKEYLAYYTIKERWLALGSFKNLEEQLPSDRFLRVHKSYLIALPFVRSWFGHELEMEGGFKVPVGGTYRETIVQKLGLP